MPTRRSVLKWSIGMTAALVSGIEFSARRIRLTASYAQIPGQLNDVSIQTWMDEWMSISKSPGGMLKISRFREPMYFLIAPISWKPNQDQAYYKTVRVPRGFVTDFASIPPLFWSVLRPDGEYAYAAVVHDYLYWDQSRSRDEADHIFKMAMEDFKIDPLMVGALYKAVRLVGKVAWNSNADKKSQGEKRILARLPQDPRIGWDEWRQRPGVFAP